MTSPSQLKYLDAMGIPVWVLRDRYQDNTEEQVQSSIDEASQNSQSSISADPVESILQSLDHTNSKTKEAKPLSVTNVQLEEISSKQKGNREFKENIQPTQNEIARTESHILYACGNINADWMVVGESPDINDDRLNQPYEGESGILLENMLRAVGIDNPRQNAFMLNVIKSSLGNVTTESKGQLNKLLNEKIQQVQPRMLLVVGQLAAQNLLETKEPLARLRANEQKHPSLGTTTVVTYYPTHLISKPLDKRKAWEDLKLAMKLIEHSEPSN